VLPVLLVLRFCPLVPLESLPPLVSLPVLFDPPAEEVCPVALLLPVLPVFPVFAVDPVPAVLSGFDSPDVAAVVFPTEVEFPEFLLCELLCPPDWPVVAGEPVVCVVPVFCVLEAERSELSALTFRLKTKRPAVQSTQVEIKKVCFFIGLNYALEHSNQIPGHQR
jgi:hypothetical protein